jgi:hypothetical protein
MHLSPRPAVLLSEHIGAHGKDWSAHHRLCLLCLLATLMVRVLADSQITRALVHVQALSSSRQAAGGSWGVHGRAWPSCGWVAAQQPAVRH